MRVEAPAGAWKAAYVLLIIAAGSLAVVISIRDLLLRPIGQEWLILAALTMVSSVATLRMTSVPVSFSIADTFTFAALLLFGPAAATLTVALDGLSISLQLARRQLELRRLIFNVTAPALAMWIAARALVRLIDPAVYIGRDAGLAALLPPLFCSAFLYFVLDTGLIARAVAFDRNKPLFQVWREHFLPLWLSFFGGAYVAALAVVHAGRLGVSFFAILLPLPLILYYTFRTSLGRIDDQVRHLAEQRRAQEALQEREQAFQEQLRQAHKMETVGRLAGGVAHDFNNLLTAIIGNSELLLLQLPAEDPRRQEVEEIQKAASSAATMTRQLLTFSRKQVLQPTALDLNALVANLDHMLRRLIGEDVELITILDPALGKVRADPVQVEQVIVNLAVNARDAMARGGRLTIQTSRIEVSPSQAPPHVAITPGRYAMLAVSDNGSGMDDETRSHLFEPYFTTKERGKGTGLGLATVYGIVKQSGGEVSVQSEPGRGTTVRIYLGEAEAAEEPADPPPPARAAEAGGGPGGAETILVVEDEPAVRRLARQFLERRGYRVLEAGNGDEGIALSERHTGPIHLLLSDVIMPGIGGPELAARLAPSRPDMKVLYMSAYTANIVIHRGVQEPGTLLVEKPFTADELARRVREVLDSTTRH